MPGLEKRVGVYILNMTRVRNDVSKLISHESGNASQVIPNIVLNKLGSSTEHRQ